MAGAYSSVACAEEFDTYKEDFSVDGGPSATVQLRCKWADRYDLVDDLISNSRFPPQMEDFDNPPQAVHCAVKPFPGDEKPSNTFGVDGQVIEYAEALVSVDYSTDISDLVSESLEPTAEFLTQDHRRFRWGAGNGEPLLEAEAPGRLYQSMNIVRTRYQVPSVPPEILTLVGKINDAAWESGLLGLTFAIETLLFQPPNVSRKIATNGSDGYTFTCKFTYKPQGWNSYWRAKTQSFQKIFIVGGSEYKQYIPDNMSALLP